MTGYPSITIIIVLLVGLFLAIRNPYRAFLLSVLVIGAGNAKELNLTRTTLLGPYLNLTDICLLVALFALLCECLLRRMPPRMPRILLFILIVLSIGALQSFAVFGWDYETLRSLRWAIQFPLAFFLAANFITNPHRVKLFITTLFVAAVLAAAQHFYYVIGIGQKIVLGSDSFAGIRTISYSSGGLAEIFLLSIMIWKLPKKISSKLFFIAIGSLFMLSVLMNQTRSVWFAMIFAIPIVAKIFQLRQRYDTFFRIGVIAVVSASLAILLCSFLIPDLDIAGMVNKRFSLLFDTSGAALATGGPTSGRLDAIRVEMTDWLDGTLVLGRGLNYFKNMQGKLLDIAFGHVGYVTYLSQLGIIGFFVYAIFLPLSVIRNCRRVWLSSQVPIVRYAVFLSASSMIYNCIMFTMSSCFLSLGSFVPGVLAGMAWAISRVRIVDKQPLQNRKNIAFTNKHEYAPLYRNE